MEFNDFLIKSIRVGPEKNFSYLIICRTTQKAALVDVAFDLDRLLEDVHENDCFLESVFVTHWHRDHSGLVSEIVKSVPGLKIYAHRIEIQRLLTQNVHVTHPLEDGDIFNLGSIKIKALHTPGHTEGGCSYLIFDSTSATGDSSGSSTKRPVVLLSGDTLFIDQCGRTDLIGGSDKDLFESLQKLKALPKDVRVYPGHDYGQRPSDTLGEQCQTNPAMKALDISEFLSIP